MRSGDSSGISSHLGVYLLNPGHRNATPSICTFTTGSVYRHPHDQSAKFNF